MDQREREVAEGAVRESSQLCGRLFVGIVIGAFTWPWELAGGGVRPFEKTERVSTTVGNPDE